MNKLLFIMGAVVGFSVSAIVDKKRNMSEEYEIIVPAEEVIETTPTEQEAAVTEEDVWTMASDYVSEKHPDEDYDDLIDELEYYQDAPNAPKKSRPFVICQYQYYNTNPEYDKIDVTYYIEDMIMAEDATDEILDIDEYIGEDNLLEFGNINDPEGRYPSWPDEDDDLLFIRNDKLAIDYRIIRIQECYSERILGIPMEEWEGPNFDK